jgi:hypothetical protein
MTKFLIQAPRDQIIAISLLIMLSSFLLFVPTPCRAENPVESYQFVSEIQLASSLPTEMKVEDVQIQNVVRMSYVCTNEGTSDIPWSINQGRLTWEIGNYTVQSANITDNWVKASHLSILAVTS